MFTAVACVVFMAACKKEPLTQDQTGHPSPKPSTIDDICIVNGMLSFADAEFYDAFVALPEQKALDVLSAYEESAAFESLAESRLYVEDEIYTPLISSLLNRNRMIHIENRVYKINAERGHVYSIPSEHINNPEAIRALADENTSNELVHVNSVEEDLWEISGLSASKNTQGEGCPTIPVNQILDRGDFTSEYSTSDNCIAGNSMSNIRLWTYLRYYRYGILFELLGRSRETDSPSLSPQANTTCNTITLDSPTCTFRRNHSGYEYNLPPKTSDAKGEVKYKPYSWGNRLCWFYWTAKTSRSSVAQETAVVELKHNYP